MNRLIFSQSSCRDGVWTACYSACEVVVSAVPLGRGMAPGVAVPDGVGVAWGVGGRSSRGAVWCVEVEVGAVCFGVPYVQGLGFSHPPRYFGVRGRGTTALPFRVTLDLEGSSGAVVAAVPGFAALGSSGGRFPRLPLYVEVVVVVIVPGS